MTTWNLNIEPPKTESCGLTISNKDEKRKDEKYHKTKSKSCVPVHLFYSPNKSLHLVVLLFDLYFSKKN